MTNRTTNSRAFAAVSVPAWLLALVAVTFMLREARTLFVPVALAVLVAAAVSPILIWFDRMRFPRSVSATVVVAVFAGAAGWTGWVLSDDVAQMARELPQQIRQLRGELQASPTATVLDDLNQAAVEAQGPSPATGQQGESAGQAQSGSEQSSSAQASSATSGGMTGALASYLWEGSTNLFSVIGHLAVITFLTYLLLASAGAWHDRIVRLLGTMLSSRRTGAEVLNEIAQQVQRFLMMRFVTSLVVAAATWGALIFFGAPAPGVWAVAAGVFNWVPYFGPVIVSGGLAIVGFVGGGTTLALQLSLTALVITSLEGWLLTPLVMGRATRMNTLAVFLSLLFWSWVWGIWGTILAVPLTSVIKAIADHVEPLGWLSDLLAGDKTDPSVSDAAP